jgi:hypothetical protein
MAITLDKTRQHTNRHQDNQPAPTPPPARGNSRRLGVVITILAAVAVLAGIVSGTGSSDIDQSQVTAENNRFAALASAGTGQTSSYDIAEQNRFGTLASVGTGQTSSYEMAERNRFAAVGVLSPATSYDMAERNRFEAAHTLGHTGDVSGTTQAENNRAAALSAINGRNQARDHSYDTAEQNRTHALAPANA